jgi:hypothetical protein
VISLLTSSPINVSEAIITRHANTPVFCGPLNLSLNVLKSRGAREGSENGMSVIRMGGITARFVRGSARIIHHVGFRFCSMQSLHILDLDVERGNQRRTEGQ